jgi:hypothetical protein
MFVCCQKVHATSHIYYFYFKGIRSNIELQVYSVTCDAKFASITAATRVVWESLYSPNKSIVSKTIRNFSNKFRAMNLRRDPTRERKRKHFPLYYSIFTVLVSLYLYCTERKYCFIVFADRPAFVWSFSWGLRTLRPKRFTTTIGSHWYPKWNCYIDAKFNTWFWWFVYDSAGLRCNGNHSVISGQSPCFMLYGYTSIHCWAVGYLSMDFMLMVFEPAKSRDCWLFVRTSE